ncbi:RNA polymerase sigma factor [Actinomadura chibensis]|uniref:RNA polymerase sigma factor n=1 Tax=Actinomadura chibensis TaxID=392828 RepID=UPI000A4A5DDD|nr:sigma-70 family RNA polymerase sigma factor [Actinomadura chibensis]
MTETSGPGVKADAVSLEAAKKVDFSDFYQESYHRLVNLLVFVLKAPVHEVEEAVQVGFIEAYRRWSKVEAPEPYVRKAATNAFFRERKRDARQADAEKRAVLAGLLNPRGRSGRELDDADDYAWVQMVIKDLPPRQRQVMLGIAKGLSNEVIASLLGINEPNVRSNARHARRRLEKSLDLKKMISGRAPEPGKGGSA